MISKHGWETRNIIQSPKYEIIALPDPFHILWVALSRERLNGACKRVLRYHVACSAQPRLPQTSTPRWAESGVLGGQVFLQVDAGNIQVERPAEIPHCSVQTDSEAEPTWR